MFERVPKNTAGRMAHKIYLFCRASQYVQNFFQSRNSVFIIVAMKLDALLILLNLAYALNIIRFSYQITSSITVTANYLNEGIRRSAANH